MLPLLWPARRSSSQKQLRHPIVDVPDILAAVLSHLEPHEVGQCLTVCKTWLPLVQQRLYDNVRVTTKDGLERSYSLVNNEANRARISRLLRGISITRSSAILFDDLDRLAPNLRALTICSDACISSAAFALVLPRLNALVSLTLINSDFRAVANPLSSIQGTSQALAAFASAREACHAPGLAVLRIVNSPDLNSEGIHEYLAICGFSLLELELSGCPGIVDWTIKDIGTYCPSLSHLTLRGTAAQTRKENDVDAARHALAALAQGCPDLSSLTLSRFPDNATWVDGQSRILECFVHLKRLQHVNLSGLPWLLPADLFYLAYPASHVRLSHLSAICEMPFLPHIAALSLTSPILSWFSLWRLHELCSTSAHLRKLVLDSTDVSLVHQTRRIRDRKIANECKVRLPASFVGYEHLSIFDGDLPSELVVEALSQATKLEHVALFGYANGRRLSGADVRKLERACPCLLRVH